MKYFKDELDNVFAYESDGSQDRFIGRHLVPMTEDEIDRHLYPMKYASEEEKRHAYLRSFKILTKRKFNLYMFDNGLFDMVQSLLASNPRAKIEFDSSDEIERTNPTVQAMIDALGWTDEEVEKMWNKALSL